MEAVRVWYKLIDLRHAHIFIPFEKMYILKTSTCKGFVKNIDYSPQLLYHASYVKVVLVSRSIFICIKFKIRILVDTRLDSAL